jgi:hypothetical protein
MSEDIRYEEGELPLAQEIRTSSRFYRGAWLRKTACVLLVSASVNGCAALESDRTPQPSYEILDKDGPTGLKISGFIPGCTSSCIDKIVRKEASIVGLGPVTVVGPNEPSPRRWLEISVDQRNSPRPIAQLWGRMIGPGASQHISGTAAPAYEAAPQIVFESSMSAFMSRFFGKVG